ncbi:MAG TPA: hypothetical protein VKX17_25070 [Planctomycetota bacterium]|nr:hypothetical protein [Planctomycetota bacterium]
MIEAQQAIALARKACEGKVELPADAPVKVLVEGGNYIVIFLQRHPPGELGADYHARVTIDAASGKVIQILAGS